MLSLTKGRQIAIIEGKKSGVIYIHGDIHEAEDLEPTIETTQENKEKIFKQFLKMDKRLSVSDMKKLSDAFEDEGKVASLGKLERKFEEAKNFVTTSLKKFLDYGKEEQLFPTVEDLSKNSVRIFISGNTGSGKSRFISDFLKHNKPKKTQGIFLFSPVYDDDSLKDIKNLIQIDLGQFERDFEKPFEYEDIPPKSIVIFDDIESSRNAKQLMEIRDMFLERGRHQGTSTLTISHNPLGHNKTKASIRESQYAVVFPMSNPRDTGALLSKYFGYTKKMIDEVMACKSRWVFVSKSTPQYWVSQHSVRLQ